MWWRSASTSCRRPWTPRLPTTLGRPPFGLPHPLTIAIFWRLPPSPSPENMFGFIRFFSFSNLAEIASTILSSTHLWMKRGLGGWSHRPWPRSGIPHPHSLCAAGRASKLSLSAQKKEKPFFLCHFLKGEILLFAHYDYQVKTSQDSLSGDIH